MDIDVLRTKSVPFHDDLKALKLSMEPESYWYPYNSMSNLGWLSQLLTGVHRDIRSLADGRPIADIGGADGDVALFLESEGFVVELIDHGATNMNSLNGARRLRDVKQSSVSIFDIDLDSQFTLPRQDYGLVLFLGILYHLQNPFYAMKALAQAAEWCALSTKVAAGTTDGRRHFADVPIAYLVSSRETNNDPTNYWVFSETGLCRLLHRTGWEVVEYMTVGATNGKSDPSSADRDQRVFALLHSGAKTEFRPPLPSMRATLKEQIASRLRDAAVDALVGVRHRFRATTVRP